MSKSKKRDGSGYYLNYMCQKFHSEGTAGCNSNLIKKEVVEEQVLTWVRTMLADEEIVNEILDRLEAEESAGTGELKKDLNIQQTSLKKLLDQQEKQDADYFAGEIRAALYNRLSEELEIKIDKSKQVITNLERGIEKLQSSVILNKDIIVEALKNFDVLFAEASNDEKRTLLRALIKEIHMEADRKSIKNIVFWFTEDDSFSHFAVPVSDVQRTVSQIRRTFSRYAPPYFRWSIFAISYLWERVDRRR